MSEELKQLKDTIETLGAELRKAAFQPAPPMPPPGYDPNAAAAGPPVDPNTGMPIDPNTGMPMQGPPPGAMPPGQGQGAPPPGAMPPGQEQGGPDPMQILQELAGAMDQVSSAVDQLAQRQEDIGARLQKIEAVIDAPEHPGA